MDHWGCQGSTKMLPVMLRQDCERERVTLLPRANDTSHHSKQNPRFWLTAVFHSFGAKAGGIGENL